jgi:hypothetical protein
MKTLLLGFAIGTSIAIWASRTQAGAALVQRRSPTSEPTKAAAPSPTSAEDQDDELDQLTRGELYQRAQQASIPGRSAMSKDELIAALRRASA